MGKCKVVYLFGAGASEKALPMVKDIPEKLGKVIHIFDSNQFKLSENDEKSKYDYQQLIADLNWLEKESANHLTIDTFAKKLYLRKEWQTLQKLKVALSVFFVVEQMFERPDKRYDAFYASILNKGVYDFPKDLRILSWNYDYQFELNYMSYTGNWDLSHNKVSLNIIEKLDASLYSSERFAIYKLNGTTNLSVKNDFSLYPFFNDFSSKYGYEKITKEYTDTIVEMYADFKNRKDVYSCVSFAWEKMRSPYMAGDKMIVDHAIEDIKEAECLVVIGYSFPYFNRAIDKKIIHSMGNLSKVYFQDPNAKVIRERFNSVMSGNQKNIETVIIKDTEQFHIPDEL